MGDALAASTGRSGGARGRFPGAARAQAAPLHEPERRQAPPFGGMSGGRAFQIGPAHEGGGPGRGNPPDVEVFRLGNSGTIVSLWHFCISFSDAYTEGRGVTAWRRSLRRLRELRPAAVSRGPPGFPIRHSPFGACPVSFADTPTRRNRITEFCGKPRRPVEIRHASPHTWR